MIPRGVFAHEGRGIPAEVHANDHFDDVEKHRDVATASIPEKAGIH